MCCSVVVLYALQHQYIFIHDALSEYINLGDSSVPIEGLRKCIWRLSEADSFGKSGYAQELAVSLSHLSPVTAQERYVELLLYLQLELVRLLSHVRITGHNVLLPCS